MRSKPLDEIATDLEDFMNSEEAIAITSCSTCVYDPGDNLKPCNKNEKYRYSKTNMCKFRNGEKHVYTTRSCERDNPMECYDWEENNG